MRAKAFRGREHLMARPPKPAKSVETLTHDAAPRRNIPTAEFQSMAEHLEERSPSAPAHYPRARPLAPGERRERDEDLDPQIIWNGMRIRLTDEQRRQLVDTGEVEIGDAQLVWRGKDAQDWSDLVVQTPPLYIQEKIQHWSNRMILGDSLSVMASLAQLAVSAGKEGAYQLRPSTPLSLLLAQPGHGVGVCTACVYNEPDPSWG